MNLEYYWNNLRTRLLEKLNFGRLQKPDQGLIRCRYASVIYLGKTFFF